MSERRRKQRRNKANAWRKGTRVKVNKGKRTILPGVRKRDVYRYERGPGRKVKRKSRIAGAVNYRIGPRIVGYKRRNEHNLVSGFRAPSWRHFQLVTKKGVYGICLRKFRMAQRAAIVIKKLGRKKKPLKPGDKKPDKLNIPSACKR